VEDLAAEGASAFSRFPSEILVHPKKKHPEPGIEEEGGAQWDRSFLFGNRQKHKE
jgi:hypothetical protein